MDKQFFEEISFLCFKNVHSRRQRLRNGQNAPVQEQCDQMTILIVQYLAIHSDENVCISIKYWQISLIFGSIINKPVKIANEF